jgi:hypothetical protein
MRALLPLALALTLAPALPGAARAQGWQPPAGCEIFVTVQARGCRVSNHFRCAGDPAGDQWRVDFDQEGPFFQSRINAEAEWVESSGLPDAVIQRLGDRPDPASFSELLSSGLDTFEFGLDHSDGTATRVTGFDRLTGQSVVIDGITLKETEFEFTETDPAGTILRQSRGREFIHPEWRLFFAGPSEWNGGEGFVPIDGSPRQFIFPGEPGFAATQPIFDCDAILSFAPGAAVVPARATP